TINVDALDKPIQWQQNPILLSDGYEGVPFFADLSGSVANPEGLSLKFELVSRPEWINITALGTLFGTPTASDVGPINLNIQVSASSGNGNVCNEFTQVKFTVVHGGQSFSWLADTIALPDTTVGTAYSQNLVPYVSNPDNKPLTFSMIKGPS